MKNSKKIQTLAVAIVLIAIAFVSCQKEVSADLSAGTSNVKVFLTDGPVNFEHAFIDLQMVEVKVEKDSCNGNSHDSNDDHGGSSDDNSSSDDNGGDDNSSSHDSNDDDSSCEVWETLQINAGVYDLLEFRNGVDALLASGSISKGELKAIRLTLGNNNSVVIDSVSYPLQLKEKNKVIIKLEDVEKTDDSNFKLNLDFDLASSIRQNSNNQFELRPRIKPFNENRSGRVEGRVLPRDAKAIVSLISDKDTLVALPGNEGEFKIRGIRSSKFDLHFNATANGYKDTTIKNISVIPGQELKIGSIVLHK
jgi:Domain of unknown function (DUF4382)